MHVNYESEMYYLLTRVTQSIPTMASTSMKTRVMQPIIRTSLTIDPTMVSKSVMYCLNISINASQNPMMYMATIKYDVKRKFSYYDFINLMTINLKCHKKWSSLKIIIKSQ